MDRIKVQQKIQKIISDLHSEIGAKASRKQYPAARWQIERLQALDILDLMPCGFGHSDATAVLKEAEASPSAVFNAEGEGEDIPASTLHQAIHAPATPVPDDPGMMTEKQRIYLRDLLYNIQTCYDNHPRHEELRVQARYALTFVAFIHFHDLSRQDASWLINLARDYPWPVEFMIKFVRLTHPRERPKLVGEVAAEYLDNLLKVARSIYEDDSFWPGSELDTARIDARDESTLNELFRTFEF